MTKIVLKLGWKYISIVYEESNYGIKARTQGGLFYTSIQSTTEEVSLFHELLLAYYVPIKLVS